MFMQKTLSLKFLLLFVFITSFLFSIGQKSMVTNRVDNARTGWNKEEYILNKSNVRPGSFGKIFTRTIDDMLFAQP